MTDLSTAKKRAQLARRGAPYFYKISPGKHLGFRRGAQTWVARLHKPGRDRKHHPVPPVPIRKAQLGRIPGAALGGTGLRHLPDHPVTELEAPRRFIALAVQRPRRFDIQLVLFAIDEVITGFRIAYGGAQERFGVTPDLATYGKVLGGGLPVGAIAGRAEVMEVFTGLSTSNGVFSGGTFS